MAIVSDGIYIDLELSEGFAFAYKRAALASDVTVFYVASIQAIPTLGRAVSASDTVNSTDSASNYFYATKSVDDTVATAESVTTRAKFSPSVVDRIRTVDLSSIAYVQSLADSFGLAPQLVATQALVVLERVGISRQVLARALYKLTVSEAVRMLDGLLRFFSGEIADSLSFSESSAAKKMMRPQLQDSLGIDESVERILVLRVTAPDSVNIDDVSLTQMFFDAKLADLLDIAALYVAPNDAFTIWNVNAVTGAVSQYDNYAFNSFARFGQMYIGADENGLYELSGCNDDGDAIIARVRSGLAQLTASRFTMIRDAYIGIRSDGVFVLRVTTGEGQTFDYKFDAQNMKTTRVPLGKGMRTRYMSFELISTGDDFDLESVEFIPLMSSRRV